jgi:hypothetical protein
MIYVISAIVLVAGTAFDVVLIQGARLERDKWTWFVNGAFIAITTAFVLVAAAIFLLGVLGGWCTHDCFG